MRDSQPVCPKCDTDSMFTKIVDDGGTSVYECGECGERWV